MGATGLDIGEKGKSLWYKYFDKEIWFTIGRDDLPLENAEASVILREERLNTSFADEALKDALLKVIEENAKDVYKFYLQELKGLEK